MLDIVLFVLPVLIIMIFIIHTVGGIGGGRKNYYREKLATIKEKAAGDMNAQTLAVIEADKLLDSLLKEKKFKGNTMGERLKSAQPSLANSHTIWQAHKFRNKIVHENITISKRQVSSAIAAYETELKKLGGV